MKKLFGSADLCHCLNRLGFRYEKQQHGTSHVKFFPPASHSVPKGIRPFMIIQLNKKQFDRHTCSRYVTEIVLMGFDRKKVIEVLDD